jgi:hypothetical protein
LQLEVFLFAQTLKVCLACNWLRVTVTKNFIPQRGKFKMNLEAELSSALQIRDKTRKIQALQSLLAKIQRLKSETKNYDEAKSLFILSVRVGNKLYDLGAIKM